MNKYLFGAFLFLGIALTSAQECNYQLSGEITDFHDGTFLENSVVQIKNINKYAVTNSKGFFQIENICAGVYKVEISHLGCETLTKTIYISKGTVQNFKLEHHLEDLNEVLVNSKSIAFKRNSGLYSSLNSKVIDKYSSFSLGDALKEIRGVSSLNTGGTIVKPVIHGLHSSRVLVIHNNVRMHDQEWGVEHAPNLDANTGEQLTVVKGASALQYGGDAIGGVVLVSPKKAPVMDTLFGKTIVGLSSNGRGSTVTSSILKATKKGWYFKGQGTYKYFGDFETPNYILSNTGLREDAFSLGIGLNKFTYGFDFYYSKFHTEIGILRASHIGTTTDLVAAINSSKPLIVKDFTYKIGAPKQDVVHELVKLNFFKRFESLGKLSSQYAYQKNKRKEFDIRKGDKKGIASLDMELSTHTLATSFIYDANSDFKASLGMDLIYQINIPNSQTGVRRLIPDYKMYGGGLYSLVSYQLSDAFSVDGGIRYDFSRIDAKKFYLKSRWDERKYNRDFAHFITKDFRTQWLVNPIFNQHAFSGSLGGKYAVNENLNMKANLSTASRVPNPSEYFSDGLHHSAAAIELGDLRLKKETSLKSSLSFEGNFKRINFSLDTYMNKVFDFMVLEPIGIEPTLRGSFLVWEYKQVNALLAGMDFYLSYRFSDRIHVNSSFSYLYGEDLSADKPLIAIPAPSISTNMVYTLEALKNFKLTLKSKAVFEQKKYPNNDFSYTAQNPVTHEVETNEVKISKPPGAYHLLGMDVETSFETNAKSIITVGLTVTNLLNVVYSDYLNRQRYYANDNQRNISIQLKYNY